MLLPVFSTLATLLPIETNILIWKKTIITQTKLQFSNQLGKRVGTLIVAGAFQIFLKSNDFPLPHGSHDVKRLFFGYYVTTLKAKGAQVTPFCHMTMGKLMRK